MKIYVTWKSSIKAIIKNRRRSVLTMLGIIIGIGSVIAVISLGKGFEKYTLESLAEDDNGILTVDVFFTPNDTSMLISNVSFFSAYEIANVNQIEGVKEVSTYNTESDKTVVEVKAKSETLSKIVEPVENTDMAMLVGRNLSKNDYVSRNKVVIIDSETATELYGSVENALHRGININNLLFYIVGVYESEPVQSIFSTNNTHIYFSNTTYEHYFSVEEGNQIITVSIEEGFQPNIVMSNIIQYLEEYGSMKDLGTYSVFDTAMLTDGIGAILSTVTYFIAAVAGISLFIAGIGVMNMMYISVAERIKEIGIRRAMGATRQSIKLQFLLEGVSITVIGGIIGYIFGIILAQLVASLLDFSAVIDFQTIGLAIGISTIIGLVFSVVPASTASKKELIDILR